MAFDSGVVVKEIPYERLRERLREDGQILRVEDVRKNKKTRFNDFRSRFPRS